MSEIKEKSRLADYKNKRKDLLEYLGKSRYWLDAVTAQGKLTSPRDPNNNYRIYTDEQMEKIAEEFSPGGEGEWHFEGGK